MTLPSAPLEEDILTLEGGGHIAVALPETLSKSQFDDLKEWLDLIARKAERRVVAQPDPGNHSSPADSGDDDSDSLSWE